MPLIIYRKTDDSIDIDGLPSGLALGTKVWLTIKKDYDDDMTDSAKVYEDVQATTVVNQSTITFNIDSDDALYDTIEYGRLYIMGILTQSPVASSNDRWTPLELNSGDGIIFKKTVKNDRPNYTP
jgi:hypothetical protein